MQAILALEPNRVAPTAALASTSGARLAEAGNDGSGVLTLCFALKHVSAPDLRAELRACQQRLGTVQERPDDMDWARALAHEINNRRQVEYLRAMLALDDGAATAATFGMAQLVA